MSCLPKALIAHLELKQFGHKHFLMATPKKLYSVESGIDLSSCRICGSVVDQHYCKNLFSNAGRELLNMVQEIHGAVLTKDKALPSLACRPCERKVKNAWNIKQRIAQTQDSLEKKTRTKRCINVSPSSGQPQQKTRHIAARRSLGFETLLVSLFYLFHLTIAQNLKYICFLLYGSLCVYYLAIYTRQYCHTASVLLSFFCVIRYMNVVS